MTRSSTVGRRGAGQTTLVEHERVGVLLQPKQELLFPLPLLLLAPHRHRHRHEREHDRHCDQQHGHRVASCVRPGRNGCSVPHAFAILGCHASTATPRVVVRPGTRPPGGPGHDHGGAGCGAGRMRQGAVDGADRFRGDALCQPDRRRPERLGRDHRQCHRTGRRPRAERDAGELYDDPRQHRSGRGSHQRRQGDGPAECRNGVGRGADSRLFRRRPGRSARDPGRGRGGVAVDGHRQPERGRARRRHRGDPGRRHGREQPAVAWRAGHLRHQRRLPARVQRRHRPQRRGADAVDDHARSHRHGHGRQPSRPRRPCASRPGR